MKTGKSNSFAMATLAFGVMAAAPLAAATVVNGGFNDQSGWTTENDAELANAGGAAGWTWTTPVVGHTITSAEAVAPTEGTGFGITYAGADSFTQSVTFASAGEYTFSVDANALAGMNTSLNSSLVDGAFQFLAGGATSSVYNLDTDNGWVNWSWTTTLAAGTYDIGFQNTLAAIYATAYDNFQITPSAVPVPAAGLLLLTAIAGFGSLRRRK